MGIQHLPAALRALQFVLVQPCSTDSELHAVDEKEKWMFASEANIIT